MGLHLGNSGIKKVYLGNNEVSKIYLGLDLVYQNRPVGIPIEGAPNGAYILRTDNLLYSEELWDSKWNNEAVGIAVIDSKHPNGGFVISKDDDYVKRKYGAEKQISGVPAPENSDGAKEVYDGELYTDKIIEQDSTAEAAIYCRNYIFPNGKRGYLGASGEWWLAAINKELVSTCLAKIGGSEIYAESDYPYISSTQKSLGGYYHFCYAMYWSGPVLDSAIKRKGCSNRPFCSLN